jgi:multidrug resistance efflux pump
MKKYLVIITILAACLMALSGCTTGAQANPMPQPTVVSTKTDHVVAEGRLVPVMSIDLSFAASGHVDEVLVSQGETVEEGQVLARLEGAENYRSQAAAARLELIQVKQDLLHLDENAFLRLADASAEVEAARKAYDAVVSIWTGGNAKYTTTFDAALKDYIDAEKDVRDAQTKANTMRDQPEDAPARIQAEKRLADEVSRRADAYQAMIENYEKPREGANTENRTPLVQAVARLESALLQLDKLQGKADPEQKALLEARLEAAETALAAAEHNLRMLELCAPFAGSLVRWDLKSGQFFTPGQVVGALADVSSWMVETTDLSENDVVMLQVGSPVMVSVNALPDENYTGVVESIQGKGEKIQGDMTYKVRIQMDQTSPRWYWNMIVKVNAE